MRCDRRRAGPRGANAPARLLFTANAVSKRPAFGRASPRLASARGPRAAAAPRSAAAPARARPGPAERQRQRRASPCPALGAPPAAAGEARAAPPQAPPVPPAGAALRGRQPAGSRSSAPRFRAAPRTWLEGGQGPAPGAAERVPLRRHRRCRRAPPGRGPPRGRHLLRRGRRLAAAGCARGGRRERGGRRGPAAPEGAASPRAGAGPGAGWAGAGGLASGRGTRRQDALGFSCLIIKPAVDVLNFQLSPNL